ncbi:MAG: HAD-IC family P-type ATPase [Candidatus Taylorbacteria bacterium]|nr:HAD-IC family P-type ATPase [Candidatus Taylorbacteria bacterium]
MKKVLAKYKIKSQELWYIIARNVFLFTNGVIVLVIILLFAFGDKKSALFLGIIFVFNILMGFIQEISAWIQLEKLQLLTAPQVIRINKDGTEESVLADQIKKWDLIKLKIGDQIPTDSILVKDHSFEINEGLITGESNSIPKNINDHLLAGSVVTAGYGIAKTDSVFKESRIARMTEGIKKYSIKFSPIQTSVNLLIKYCGYVLVVIFAFIITRGIIVHEPIIKIVKNIGSLTNTIMPVGLFFAVSLFFTYGAFHLFKRHVLLQEVNSTEKLGRIKNLCMDKTGTLTENTLAVEDIFVTKQIDINSAQDLTMAYIEGTGDTSETLNAVKKFIGGKFEGEVVDFLSFSSWRKYGAVSILKDNKKIFIFAGSPNVFLPHLNDEEDKKWLQKFLDEEAHMGKHVWCVVESINAGIVEDISKAEFSIVAVYVFYNNLREGIKHTINFFQERGVHIRIISGDNKETVRTVANLAGINNTDKIITGSEMQDWSEKDFEKNVGQYTIFARIIPEQKEKIIEAFKKDGFTAMVGDGANDVLAIKKADLGIAMFDGAKATRQIASIVLTNNSFTAMPGGVTLADSIIRNIEIFASIYLNLTFVGFFFFIFVSCLGYAYPLTPLNISLISYFVIGIPGMLISYWTIMPSGKVDSPSSGSFLKKILPFIIYSSIVQSIFLALVFFLSPENIRSADSNIFVIIAYIVSGFVFFIFTPYVYRGAVNVFQKAQIFTFALIEIALFLIMLNVPIAINFFDIVKVTSKISMNNFAIMSVSFILLIYIQYMIAKYFAFKKKYDDKK